ncbi:Retrovirus-related Pol polyprotein from type-1 retrotransposable element R1 2 [Eumeta japonica]|uniref:Retrovirus-related Pol polyprotein from type-1 retrotransposable element R1 2 n=1 Tax=Eumeta variegata TaxID=151549 RepID=A0A4C2AB35_EUMVA|nr:Retrovirus-related Pol polyprotein from type-1 retrotransposable element R1 2 [Eumeta japonica]
MECPQGSVLGPTLWNILLDDLLRLPYPDGVRTIAYADDVTVLIGGQSRADIERKAEISLKLINSSDLPQYNWQATRSEQSHRRPSLMVLDASLSFAQHAVSIVERASKCFGKLSRVSATSWGIRYEALKVLYRGTFVATLTYAAGYWVDRIRMYVGQHGGLAGAGWVLPADLEVNRAGKLDIFRLTATRTEIRARKRGLWEDAVMEWQERWTQETRGRQLHRFFPDVAVRLSADWIAPDYETSQILTGHGCFRKRLHDMKLCETSECMCGMEDEDVHHVLWSCPMYDELRKEMLDGLTRTTVGPVYYPDLVASQANFRRLVEFARAWHGLRGGLE